MVILSFFHGPCCRLHCLKLCVVSQGTHSRTHVGSENGSWGLVESQHLLKLGHNQPSHGQPFSLWMDGRVLLASGPACQNGKSPTLSPLKAQNHNARGARADLTVRQLRAVINHNRWRRQQGRTCVCVCFPDEIPDPATWKRFIL